MYPTSPPLYNRGHARYSPFMRSFEQFVEGLGDFGKQYNEGQLHQLHREVQALAQLIIEVHRIDPDCFRRIATRQLELDFSNPPTPPSDPVSAVPVQAELALDTRETPQSNDSNL